MMRPLKTIPHRVVVLAATVGAVLAAMALLVWAIAAIPRVQVRGVIVEGQDRSVKTAELIDKYRSTLVQAIGGVFLVVIGGASGAYFTWRQFIITREAEINARFANATAMLGHQDLQMRLGGIYALERIARDSPKDQWTIVETLAGFIRQHAPAPAKTPDAAPSPRDVNTLPPLRTDIQAALTVLARRNQITEPGRIDLRRTDLARADLADAHLERALLWHAHLEVAHLRAAHLEGADLRNAHLENALLSSVYLEGALLSGAHLHGAYLVDAHLKDADLARAHLNSAMLRGAHLADAMLAAVDLEGAILWGAHLDGVDLRSADLSKVYELTREQVVNAITDEHTKFPWTETPTATDDG
jgi:hypothetical protein